MGDLVEFPVEPEAIQIEGPPIDMEKCSGVIHVFDDVTGHCECGEETWPEKPDANVIGIHSPPWFPARTS